MTQNIYEKNAPLYFKAGLSALPVKVGSKGTNVLRWTKYCTTLPNASCQESWPGSFKHSGIAIALGTELENGMHLGAIDIDDDRIVPIVDGLFPNVPCAKIGKKGKTIFIKYKPVQELKSGAIKLPTGEGGIDVLLRSRMTVIPPTIHPDIGKPYEWIGKPLLECNWPEIPILTSDHIKILKYLISRNKSLGILLDGNIQPTHEAGIQYVIALKKAKFNDAQITKVFESILPKNYSGDTLNELPKMIEWAEENINSSSDFSKEDKISATQLMVQIVFQQELLRDVEGTVYINLNTKTEEEKVC